MWRNFKDLALEAIPSANAMVEWQATSYTVRSEARIRSQVSLLLAQVTHMCNSAVISDNGLVNLGGRVLWDSWTSFGSRMAHSVPLIAWRRPWKLSMWDEKTPYDATLDFTDLVAMHQ